MKIAIAGGHSKKAPGASGYLDEYECDRAYVAQLIKALRAAGHTVADCSNEKATQASELAEEVRLAKASGADLFVAVHLNAGGGTGTECWYWDGNQAGKSLAARMSANVAAALGIKDRGAKPTTGLFVLRNAPMTAVLLEVCFVDTKADADAWNRTSWDKLTKAVVDALGTSGSAAAAAADGKWVKDSKGWWHQYKDGTYPKSTWLKLDAWYWFDSSGYAAASCCLKIAGKWYAFGSDCRMLTSVKVNANGDLGL